VRHDSIEETENDETYEDDKVGEFENPSTHTIIHIWRAYIQKERSVASMVNSCRPLKVWLKT
jgi:hypothetical protein